MPKDTFANLPPAKRRRVLDAALEEFAARSYEQASLTRIVRNAGIAKGSMYQYFEDKFDLYCHLLEVAVERKLSYIDEAIGALGPDPGFFATLRAAVGAGFRLAREDPRLLALGNRLALETDTSILGRVTARLGARGEDTIEKWLREGMARGEIDPQVRPAIAAHLVWVASSSVSQGLAAGKLSVDQAEALLAEIIGILERGLRPSDQKRGEATP
jgi:AcrR family transcriptional regulator